MPFITKMTYQQVAPGFNIQMQQPCPKCGGKGKMFKHKCEVCGGSKLVNEAKELKVVIERGMRDGEQIVFERMSEQHPDMIPGDVVVTLKQAGHATFTRRAQDLTMTMKISLKEVRIDTIINQLIN